MQQSVMQVVLLVLRLLRVLDQLGLLQCYFLDLSGLVEVVGPLVLLNLSSSGENHQHSETLVETNLPLAQVFQLLVLHSQLPISHEV